ncbi:15423_t:CDS:2 [Funneliformis caledonium]|uniref:15423_t:CDS:1 n=1 Tax=Funneliformis caledonium TaxID=1117310 RepID=A0A9N8YXC2_9GLOM|nr:15423_t:CDS:2 [Funneliformis caledonium]
MLRVARCTEITPFLKDQLEYEFWSQSSNPLMDQNTLEILYHSGFLNAIPTNVFNLSNQFWKCFQKLLEESKIGYNGKIQILSIIANDFEYEELQKNLK